MSNIVFAIIFALLGLLLSGYLLFILVGALAPLFSNRAFPLNSSLSFNPWAYREKYQLSKCMKLLKVVDEKIAANDLDVALSNLRNSFFLGHVQISKSILEESKNHNTVLLNRLLTIGEKKGLRLRDLPELEELFDERARLLDLYFDSSLLHDKIRDKYKREGRDRGSWDGAEFERQMAELKADIEKNRLELLKELEAIFVAIKRGEKDDGTIYH